jgi:hypothetical protein
LLPTNATRKYARFLLAWFEHDVNPSSILDGIAGGRLMEAADPPLCGPLSRRRRGFRATLLTVALAAVWQPSAVPSTA